MTKKEIINIFNSSPRIERFVFWDKKTQDYDFDASIASFNNYPWDNNSKFANDVIEFFAKISLTYTIVGITVYVDQNTCTKEMYITLSYNVTDTNIDCEVLDAILTNIN